MAPARIADIEGRLTELAQSGVHTVRRPDGRKTLAVVVSTPAGRPET